MAQATNLGATDSASGLAPSPEASASPASEVGDMREAAATAAAFETARASAAWSAAWVMLSAYSQAQYGSESMFAATEASYNAAGGTTFTLANPTRNPDLLDLTFLGAPGADAEAHADFSRAALVFANHPKVRGASEASRAYLIAPVASGVWQIWIVR